MHQHAYCFWVGYHLSFATLSYLRVDKKIQIFRAGQILPRRLHTGDSEVMDVVFW